MHRAGREGKDKRMLLLIDGGLTTYADFIVEKSKFFGLS